MDSQRLPPNPTAYAMTTQVTRARPRRSGTAHPGPDASAGSDGKRGRRVGSSTGPRRTTRNARRITASEVQECLGRLGHY
jgi:hypothetical protein